jgi:hypothetical protein
MKQPEVPEGFEVKNAIIESTSLGLEDHGFLTFCLYLNYGGSGQGAGNRALSYFKRDSNERSFFQGTGRLIWEILDVVGVERWEDLPGKHIRVIASWGTIDAIGNILDDKWLHFSEFFGKYLKDEEK